MGSARSCPPGVSLLRLQQLVQLFERFSVLGGDRVMATGVCPLQSTNHLARFWEWNATVIGFAHKVPLRSGLTVTFETVTAKSIDDVGHSSFSNSCPIFRHVELEELPIMRR